MISMNPTAFSIFGIDIRWYGIIISIGVITALALAYFNSKRKGVDFDHIVNTFLVAFPIAVIGARLYYVAFEFESYRGDLLSIFNIRQGGLAIHGGVIFGVAAALIYSRVKHIDFLGMIDIAAPSLILAQGIGRWGNFFNSEAHGGEVSYEFISRFPQFIQKGMYINGAYYHPTFLYESLWDAAVCIVLLIILKKRKEDEKGLIISLYLILYSLGRFYIEGLRTDSLLIGNFRIAQIMSLAGIVIGIAAIILIKIVKRKKYI